MSDTIAIAGGSGGLGAALCRHLGSQGLHIVVGYHSRKAAAESVAQDIVAAGGSAVVCAVDLCDAKQVAEFLAQSRSGERRLIGVVNATGPAIPLRPLSEISGDTFSAIMRTDVEGAFNLLTQAGALFAAAGGGSVVQLLTTAVLRTLENDAMSGIPKTAISGIVRQLARELGPQNVRFNGIAPGVIDAGIVHSSFAADPVAEGVINDCLAKTPMPRLGKPEEVSALAAFLLSDAAGYINGQIIGIDGGYSA
jgi:3-oxoacyl-[acyl-carrier protein] reductase